VTLCGWAVGAGRCDARCFEFAGLKWTRSYDGILCWFGIGRVLVFYVHAWREA
jgi:hypothetical protein